MSSKCHYSGVYPKVLADFTPVHLMSRYISPQMQQLFYCREVLGKMIFRITEQEISVNYSYAFLVLMGNYSRSCY